MESILKWELVENNELDSGINCVERACVPGGWIVRSQWFTGEEVPFREAFLYVSDPNHAWKGLDA